MGVRLTGFHIHHQGMAMETLLYKVKKLCLNG